jgi:hypothetical protein
LPIPATVFESAIRADGKAVDANLKGFRSGLEAAQKTKVTVGEGGAAKRGRLPASSVVDLERRIIADMPPSCVPRSIAPRSSATQPGGIACSIAYVRR